MVGIVIDVSDKNSNIVPEKKADAQSIIVTTGADYLHILPSASLNKSYLSSVQSVPETIFVDSAGRQVGPSYIGAKSQAQWEKIIDKLLKDLA